MLTAAVIDHFATKAKAYAGTIGSTISVVLASGIVIPQPESGWLSIAGIVATGVSVFVVPNRPASVEADIQDVEQAVTDISNVANPRENPAPVAAPPAEVAPVAPAPPVDPSGTVAPPPVPPVA